MPRPWSVRSAAATGLSPGAAGLIVTLTQIGYTLGLLFIVPLGDLLENRRLVFAGLLFTAAALVVAAFATNAAVFLAAALAIGLGSVVAQVLVPFAAHLSKEATRGHAVGKVVSGLLLGIMLARPVACWWPTTASWHVVFGGAAAADRAARLRAARETAPARADRAHALRQADRLAVASAADHARAAPPRRLPGRPVRLLQPVLDRRRR